MADYTIPTTIKVKINDKEYAWVITDKVKLNRGYPKSGEVGTMIGGNYQAAVYRIFDGIVSGISFSLPSIIDYQKDFDAYANDEASVKNGNHTVTVEETAGSQTMIWVCTNATITMDNDDGFTVGQEATFSVKVKGVMAKPLTINQ